MKIVEKNFDIETGEEVIIEREETTEETKARLYYAKEIAAKQSEAEAKENARQEILAKLGLTAEEAALILG